MPNLRELFGAVAFTVLEGRLFKADKILASTDGAPDGSLKSSVSLKPKCSCDKEAPKLEQASLQKRKTMPHSHRSRYEPLNPLPIPARLDSKHVKAFKVWLI